MLLILLRCIGAHQLGGSSVSRPQIFARESKQYESNTHERQADSWQCYLSNTIVATPSRLKTIHENISQTPMQTDDKTLAGLIKQINNKYSNIEKTAIKDP